MLYISLQVAGGITSYLIILIQFNLAAQQAKDAASSHGSNDPSQISNGADNSSEDVSDYSTALTTLMTSTASTIMTASSSALN